MLSCTNSLWVSTLGIESYLELEPQNLTHLLSKGCIHGQSTLYCHRLWLEQLTVDICSTKLFGCGNQNFGRHHERRAALFSYCYSQNFGCHSQNFGHHNQIFSWHNQKIWLTQSKKLIDTTKKFGWHNQKIWLTQPKKLVDTTKKFG